MTSKMSLETQRKETRAHIIVSWLGYPFLTLSIHFLDGS